jgi:hypothetical protein
MIFLVIILIMLALFLFGQSSMEDAFRALGRAVQVDPMKPMRCNRLELSASHYDMIDRLQTLLSHSTRAAASWAR